MIAVGIGDGDESSPAGVGHFADLFDTAGGQRGDDGAEVVHLEGDDAIDVCMWTLAFVKSESHRPGEHHLPAAVAGHRFHTENVCVPLRGNLQVPHPEEDRVDRVDVHLQDAT